MIFPTTFILTLFLTQIARADVAVGHDPFFRCLLLILVRVQATYKAVYNPVYDNATETLNDVACSELVTTFPMFGMVPFFPLIGGAPNTTYNSPNCGAIWKITNPANSAAIYFIGIDYSIGFDLSLETFLGIGGSTETGSVEVEAEIVAHLN
jgi:Cerato-platanin